MAPIREHLQKARQVVLFTCRHRLAKILPQPKVRPLLVICQRGNAPGLLLPKQLNPATFRLAKCKAKALGNKQRDHLKKWQWKGFAAAWTVMWKASCKRLQKQEMQKHQWYCKRCSRTLLASKRRINFCLMQRHSRKQHKQQHQHHQCHAPLRVWMLLPRQRNHNQWPQGHMKPSQQTYQHLLLQAVQRRMCSQIAQEAILIPCALLWNKC